MEPSKDYEHYNTRDFIADDRFLQWVRFPDAESDTFWQQWIAAHPHKKEQADEARAFIEALRFEEALPAAAAVEAALERNLAMIAALEQEQASPAKLRRLRRAGWWAAAAVLAGCLALAGRQLWQKQFRMLQYTGLSDGVRRVRLPDSSEVILNANAEISFRDNWQQAAKRE